MMTTALDFTLVELNITFLIENKKTAVNEYLPLLFTNKQHYYLYKILLYGFNT